MFKKSSRCAADKPQCVEVDLYSSGYVRVRDSKKPDGPELWFYEDEWTAFIEGAKQGEFDVVAAAVAV